MFIRNLFMQQKRNNLSYQRWQSPSMSRQEDQRNFEYQRYSSDIQNLISDLHETEKNIRESGVRKVPDNDSVFSFSERKSLRRPIFENQSNSKIRQSLPFRKPIGETNEKNKLYRTTMFTERQSVPSPSKRIDFKKTFEFYQESRPVHNSEILIKEKEAPLQQNPQQTPMHLRHQYFKQANIVQTPIKGNFSGFYERSKLKSRSSQRVNPQTRISYRTPNKTRRHQTKGSSAQKYLPPWMEELSQRLHDGGSKNDQYYSDKCRRSEKAKRQYFDRIIKESPLASKILTQKQIESLFQELKASQPMPFWQARVVNAWSFHLKQKNQYDRMRRSAER